jgi:O-antigen/teichoic acid export membrane protein
MIARGAAELAALAAAAVTSVWISRLMGAQYLGLFAVASTILAFAQAVTDAGLPSLGAQLIANDPASERAVWARVTRSRSYGAALGAILGCVCVAAIGGQSPLRILLFGSVIGLAVSPANATFALVAIGAMRSVALVRALGALFSAVVAVLFIRTDADTTALAAVLVIPGIVNGVGSTALILRRQSTRGVLDGGASMPLTLGAWYRGGFHYAKADVSLFVYMSIDRLLLFVTAGAMVVGLYEAAYRLIQPFYALSTVIRESMFVQLARAITGDDSALTIKRWARMMLVPTIPVGPFLSLHAAWVIGFVYGQSFVSAAAALAILGWAITIGFVSGAVVLPFLSWNLGREYGNAVFAGNVTNVAANLVLIPPLGATGAALATVAAKIAVAGVGVATFRATSRFPIIAWSVRYLAASVVSAVASAAAWAVSGQEGLSIIAFVVAYASSIAFIESSESRSPRAIASDR